MELPAMDREEDPSFKVPDRLLKRNQARAEDVKRRKEEKESSSITEEKSDYFSGAFKSQRAAVEEMLSRCGTGAAATQTLEEATVKTQQLQNFLNDSLSFLNQYEVAQAQSALQRLQSLLAEKRDEVLPKKKFAFKSRSKVTEKVDDPDAGGAPPATTAGSGSAAAAEVDWSVRAEPCGFSNLDSAVLTLTADKIRKQDVLLSHLRDCRVVLRGSPSTLHIKHVSGCQIQCGPVSSSVFVDHCADSTLVLACQQLRTHNTQDTRVYLHVTSRAIIEDCRGVALAPFSWSYPGLDGDFAESGLDPERNNWDQVDDFNWLDTGSPSPNWTVIPEADRRTTWDP